MRKREKVMISATALPLVENREYKISTFTCPPNMRIYPPQSTTYIPKIIWVSSLPQTVGELKKYLRITSIKTITNMNKIPSDKIFPTQSLILSITSRIAFNVATSFPPLIVRPFDPNLTALVFQRGSNDRYLKWTIRALSVYLTSNSKYQFLNDPRIC